MTTPDKLDRKNVRAGRDQSRRALPRTPLSCCAYWSPAACRRAAAARRSEVSKPGRARPGRGGAGGPIAIQPSRRLDSDARRLRTPAADPSSDPPFVVGGTGRRRIPAGWLPAAFCPRRWASGTGKRPRATAVAIPGGGKNAAEKNPKSRARRPKPAKPRPPAPRGTRTESRAQKNRARPRSATRSRAPRPRPEAPPPGGRPSRNPPRPERRNSAPGGRVRGRSGSLRKPVPTTVPVTHRARTLVLKSENGFRFATASHVRRDVARASERGRYRPPTRSDPVPSAAKPDARLGKAARENRGVFLLASAIAGPRPRISGRARPGPADFFALPS
jgi:hypothetical protein